MRRLAQARMPRAEANSQAAAGTGIMLKVPDMLTSRPATTELQVILLLTLSWTTKSVQTWLPADEFSAVALKWRGAVESIAAAGQGGASDVPGLATDREVG